MKLVWLVLLILCFKESQSEIVSYTKPGSGLSFLCGCTPATQYNKTIPIKCADDTVIQMEPSGYLMRNSFGDSNNCGNLNYNTCRRKFRQTIVSLEDRIDIYKKCSNKNSCYITIAGEQQSQERLVNYPFYCHSVKSVHDLSLEVTESNNQILYFTGKMYVGQKIDCDCSASSSAPILLETFFIHLKPRTCSKVKFISETHQLFGCSTNDTILLHNRYNYIGTDFKLEIRGMEPDVEDVLFFRVLGSNLSVNCSGCTNPTGGEISTLQTSATDTTTYIHATRSKATVHTTTDRHVSAASTDQTNSVIIATLGGILAAVIIIVIVGIGLYCFLRRRKKQHKTSSCLANTSGNDEQSQYGNLDMTRDPHESNYTSFTRSNVIQKEDERF